MRENDREPAAKVEMRAERRPGRGPGAPPPGLIDRIRSAFGLGGATIRDDLEDALESGGSGEVFSQQERAMLRNVLGLHEIRVEDIMVPRADIIAVGSAMTLGEVLDVFRAAGHSRLPVHDDTLDDPRGMIHIRDFVDVLAAGSARSAVALSTPVAQANVTRPVLFVPPSMQAMDLLVKMQASRTHMALVIDEFGGTDGLVSIEDIVEMIVGDIADEHDEDEAPLIAPGADGSFLADGRAGLADVAAALGVELATADDAEEIDTIGGLVTSLCGRLPLRGEVVTGPHAFDFEILDADPRRVKRVRIRRRGDSPSPDASDRAGADAAAEPSPPRAARTDPEAV